MNYKSEARLIMAECLIAASSLDQAILADQVGKVAYKCRLGRVAASILMAKIITGDESGDYDENLKIVIKLITPPL